MPEYEPCIGLEVHARLATDSKMFCGCSSAYGAEPNTRVCPVCLGLPGALPYINARAVELALRMGIAAGCSINPKSVFARKNYFYPDLPKGYQISQYDHPLGEGGAIRLAEEAEERVVDLVRMHIEEDAGKSIHLEGARGDHTLVDMNRCGVPLLEIVSEPTLATPREAVSYLEALKQLMEYLDVCDGDMEKGSLRCDVNVSVRPKGAGFMGVRTEIKNLNSFRSVERALHFEIRRQIRLVSAGRRVEKETLLWDEKSERCAAMRSKEDVHDYRYFPEPDLKPLEVPPELIERTRASLPELPHARRKRFRKLYEIPDYDAAVLTSEKRLADYYEACVSAGAEPKAASNWIMTEVKRTLKDKGIKLADLRIDPHSLAGLIGLIGGGTISGGIAKEIFTEMVKSGREAREIIDTLGLRQISDRGIIAGAVAEVLRREAGAAEEYCGGKVEALEFLIGAVMELTRGRGNPGLVRDILRETLGRTEEGDSSL